MQIVFHNEHIHRERMESDHIKMIWIQLRTENEEKMGASKEEKSCRHE